MSPKKGEETRRKKFKKKREANTHGKPGRTKLLP